MKRCQATARFSLLLAVALAVPGCVATRLPGLSYSDVPTPSLPSAARCLVLEPPSYARSPRRRYPVLVFLHDGYGDVRTLERRGVAADLSARMSDRRLPEFLVVAPGASGSWFSDSRDGKRRWEEFLTGDFLRELETRYRILPGRTGRAITGISMGGFGAVKIALKHPGLFGAVSALSGALIPIQWEDLERYGWITRLTLKRVFGSRPDANTLAANDVWEILRDARFERPPFDAHLRAGTEDFYGLDRVAAQFGTYMNEHGIPTEVVLEPGDHDWRYWRRGLVAIAEWHAKRFSYDAGGAQEP
ncbi:MAG: alpha/beta hydrolase-fold protein [Acidobacteriota bacterium]|nr:alpha/beta hydrolase-fold protein [Acidobacteriota bacterium]